MSKSNRSLAKMFREVWKRPHVQKAVREMGLIGSQSVLVVKQVESIFKETEWYRKNIDKLSLDIISEALLIEEPNDDNLSAAHNHAISKLREIAPSFFVMGLMTGYFAAKVEVEDSNKAADTSAAFRDG